MPIPGSHDRFENHVDRIIREAMERGEFDDLPGTGRPISGAGTKDDDLWWIRRWVRRSLREDEPGTGSQDPSNDS